MDKKYIEDLAKELKTYSYDELYAAAKEYFGGNVDFGKKAKVGDKELTYTRLLELVVAGATVTTEQYVDITLWMSTYVSKCMNDVIDAAKTGYRVIVLYLEKFQKYYRSGAVLKGDYAKISMAAGQLALDPLKLSIRGAKDEMKYEDRKYLSGRAVRKEKHTVKTDEGKKEVYYTYVVEDFLTSIRNEIAIEAYELLKAEMAKSVIPKLSGYQTQSTVLNGDLRYLTTMYTNFMRSETADKKASKYALVNMARTLCRMSSVGAENYFKEIHLVSSSKNNDGKVSMNGFYLAFTPEAIKYYIDTYCPDAKFENAVYCFGGSMARIGQRIAFVDGVSEDGFFTESKVTGTYALTINGNCEPVIERSVKEMIPVVDHDATAIAFELQTKNAKETTETMNRIEKARLSNAAMSIRYVNADNKIVNSCYGAHLWLVADKEPLCRLYTPNVKGSLFEKLLCGKAIELEQVDVSMRDHDTKAMIMVLARIQNDVSLSKMEVDDPSSENLTSRKEGSSSTVPSASASFNKALRNLVQ